MQMGLLKQSEPSFRFFAIFLSTYICCQQSSSSPKSTTATLVA